MDTNVITNFLVTVDNQIGDELVNLDADADLIELMQSVQQSILTLEAETMKAVLTEEVAATTVIISLLVQGYSREEIIEASIAALPEENKRIGTFFEQFVEVAEMC